MRTDPRGARPARTARSGVVVLLFLAAAALVSVPASAPAATPAWVTYLYGPKHTSYAIAATAFTPATAVSVSPDWTFTVPGPTVSGQPSGGLFASPTVSGGVVYIGANTGVFYAVDEVTGKEVWHHDLGYVTKTTCSARGITSTATVAPDPSRGGQITVYVGGGDGYLYALRASDGALVWRSKVVSVGTTKNTGYVWASPTLSGGRIYIGISSQCDNPLIRGGLRGFVQTSGAPAGTYWATPTGTVGASGWTSAASDGTDVWMTLGNGDAGDSFEIVRLDAQTLAKEDGWVVPGTAGTDLDWGSSPTPFTATIAGSPTPMVGGCNKNGRYYALRANDLAAGPVWSTRVGVTGDLSAGSGSCLAAAIWDLTNQRLFVGGNKTTIAGASSPGSVRRLDPATGAVMWAAPLPGGPVMGSPTSSGGGVIAAGTFNNTTPSANRVYLLSAADGSVVNSIVTGSAVFAQPVFADTHLFVATTKGTLTSFSPAWQ